MLTLDERLKAQNNGQPWIDCNLRPHPRAHHWAFEFTGAVGRYFRCKRCPVATIVSQKTVDEHLARGNRVPVVPPPFLR